VPPFTLDMNAEDSSSSEPHAEELDLDAPPSAFRPVHKSSGSQSGLPKPKRFWEPPRKLLESLGDYADGRRRGGVVGKLQCKVAVLRHRFWSVVTGAEIPLNTYGLGPGLELPHPNGVVIHEDSTIGPDCRLFQQVTLGTGSKPGLPRLGARVWVGAGAKILGGVVIGDDVIIGANAVVVSDIPADSVAVGIPAVVKPRARRIWDEVQSKRGSQLRSTTAAK